MEKNIEEMIKEGLNINPSDSTNTPIVWTYKLNGSLHLGHVIPLLSIAEWLNEKKAITILLDDVEVLEKKEVVKSRLESLKKQVISFFNNLKCNTSFLTFIQTSKLRENEDYVMEFYKLISVTSENQIYDVIEDKDGLKLYSLIEPILFLNDIKTLRTHTSFIGVNKEKIIKLAEDISQQLQHDSLDFITHPVIYDYKDNLMSKTNELTSISVMDTVKSKEKKIKKYFCDDVSVETGLFGIIESIVYPFLSQKDKYFNIVDLEGTTTCYKYIGHLKREFLDKKIHPGDLKTACTNVIIEIFELFTSN